jgi:ABC-type lipoprotein release transport system permease subunit
MIPPNPALIGLAALFNFVLGLAASLNPARRAATVEPVRALRGEGRRRSGY